MKSKAILVLVLIVSILIFSFLLLQRNVPPEISSTENSPESVVINLGEYSDSGNIGTATLTETGGKLNVLVELSGPISQVPQPAHIHTGNCPRIGPVVYGITDVVNNRSETILDTSLSELLMTNSSLSINVHKSYDDFKTYTACGDIK